ncbi:hypothetical protein AB3N59_19610 [Leptospira sp. WS92.C1]
MSKKLFYQFTKEFGIQFIISIVYAYFNTDTLSSFEVSDLAKYFSQYITYFSASFFFISWITGNIVRINRTIKTESKLSDIEKLISKTVDERIQSLFGFMTGKDSFCYIDIFGSDPYEGGQFIPILIHHGENPVFNVNIELEDKILNRYKTKNYNELNKNDSMIINEFITSNHSEANPIRWNVIIKSRGGKFREEILVDFVNNRWKKRYKLYLMEDGKSEKLILENYN